MDRVWLKNDGWLANQGTKMQLAPFQRASEAAVAARGKAEVPTETWLRMPACHTTRESSGTAIDSARSWTTAVAMRPVMVAFV